MPKKLTQEEFKQRVYECVGDKYSVVSEYKGKTKPIDLKCNTHNIIYLWNERGLENRLYESFFYFSFQKRIWTKLCIVSSGNDFISSSFRNI